MEPAGATRSVAARDVDPPHLLGIELTQELAVGVPMGEGLAAMAARNQLQARVHGPRVVNVNPHEHGLAIEVVEGQILVPEVARPQLPEPNRAVAVLHHRAEQVTRHRDGNPAGEELPDGGLHVVGRVHMPQPRILCSVFAPEIDRPGRLRHGAGAVDDLRDGVAQPLEPRLRDHALHQQPAVLAVERALLGRQYLGRRGSGGFLGHRLPRPAAKVSDVSWFENTGGRPQAPGLDRPRAIA